MSGYLTQWRGLAEDYRRLRRISRREQLVEDVVAVALLLLFGAVLVALAIAGGLA